MNTKRAEITLLFLFIKEVEKGKRQQERQLSLFKSHAFAKRYSAQENSTEV